MKVFILNPNFNLEKRVIMNVRYRQPISLAIIAAILKNSNYQVKLLDANVLNYSNAQVISEIDKFQPQVLILTSTSIDRWECPIAHLDNLYSLIDNIKVEHKILTGAHGTVTPKWIMERCKVDFVIRGEPELIVKELIDNLDDAKNVKGVSWRDERKIVNNPNADRISDLDRLPLPAYDLLPMKKYGDGFSIIMTSRGCPYACSYCLKAMSSGLYVAQLPERVVEELEYLVNNFGIKEVFFQDWEFLINPDRVEQICQLLLSKNIKIKWGCNVRADDIVRSPTLIGLMNRAGCYRINLGLESASDKILKNINKKVSQIDLQKAVDILKDTDINTGFYVLLNCPGEDKKTIRETIDFIDKNNLKVKDFNFPVAYPGTPLFEKMSESEQKDCWENIEERAGTVEAQMKPFWARLYLRHYKFSQKFGSVYFLKFKFWVNLFKR